MARIYDAVVVGAGPAGATTAAELASRGLSVLLLEAKKLPRDKPCGGGLSPRTWRHLGVPIDDVVLARSGAVRLQVGRRFSAEIRARDAQIWMVRRSEFDLRLVEHAVNHGADLHQGEAAIALDGESPAGIVTQRGSYRARVLVGADGAESRVARWLGIDRPRRWMVGLEAEVASRGLVASDAAVVDLSIPWGYAWAFPRGDSYNLGVGTFSRAHWPAIRKLLDLFVAEMGDLVEGPVRPVGHRIPTGLCRGPLHSGNGLVVGDAAGVADPFFAEGISYSILSGCVAATVIASYLAGEQPDLAEYTSRLKSSLCPDARLWMMTAAFVHRFPELSVRVLAHSRWLQRLVERTIAGEVTLGQDVASL